MNNYFYVDIDDEITSVIGKLRKEKAEEIILVVPKRALIAQSLVNLRLLNKEAQKFKKKLIFVSPDIHTRKIAEKAGLLVKKYFAKSKEKQEENKQNNRSFPAPLPPKKLSAWEEAAAEEELARIINNNSPSHVLAKPQIVDLKNEKNKKVKSSRPSKKDSNMDMASSISKTPSNPFKVRLLNASKENQESIAHEVVHEVVNNTEAPAYPRVENPPELERETANLTIREKERLKNLWMEQKGIVMGKTFQSNASLDLRTVDNVKVEKENFVAGEKGIFQTTHRRITGLGKVVDLRKTHTAAFTVPNFGKEKIYKKKTKNKEILLPIFNVKLFLFFLLGILTVLGIIVGVILPEATVTIKPRVLGENLNIEVWASGEVSQTNVNDHFIPGKPISFKVKEEKTFKVKNEITGGDNRKTKVVSREDLEKAKEELIGKARQDSQEELGKKINPDSAKEIKPEDLTVGDVSFSSDKKEGEESDSFNANATITFFIVYFSKNDLENLAKSIMESGKEEKEGEVKVVDYKVVGANPLENKMEISANAVYQLTSSVDEANIRKFLVAKKKQEAEDYLKGQNDIEQFSLKIWPGWLNHLPILERKIKVEILNPSS